MAVIRFGFSVGVFLLALGSAAAGILAQGGRFSPILDVLCHFAPFYLAGGLTAALLGFLLNGLVRRLVLGLAAVASLASGSLLAPELFDWSPGPRVQGGTTFKVIQFNAWAPNPTSDAAYRWLVAQNADAIVLVEGGLLPERLLKEAHYFPSCLPCGVTVMTRRKPLRTFPPTAQIHREPYLTSATVNDSGGEITIVGVHRYWPMRIKMNAVQGQSIRALLEASPRRRMILAGDLNSTPWSFSRRRDDVDWGLIRRTRALSTWPAAQVSHNRLPAPFPYLPIDHVYAGAGWATVEVVRGPRLGSDHYPVVVTLAAVDSPGS